MKTIYLAKSAGTLFPAIGHSELAWTRNKEDAYSIVSKEGAEIEKGRMAAHFPNYDWNVVKVDQSHETIFLVVGSGVLG